MDELLQLRDFGDHADRVHARFAEAFGFGWDPSDAESEAAAISRQNLRRMIERAAQAPPDQGAPGQEMLADIYRVYRRVQDALFQSTSTWRERLIDLVTAAAQVGQRAAELSAVRGLGELGAETHAKFTECVAHLDAVCTDVEVALDAVRYAALDGVTASGATLADALTASADQVGRATTILVEVTRIGAALDALHRRPLDGALRRTHEAIESLQAQLERAIAEAPPPPDYGPNPFSEYFLRLRWALPAKSYRLRRTTSSSLNDVVHEVPPEYLIVPRTADERREVLLCWFATYMPEFWDSLPASCRRDHRPPPITGGPGSRNKVLDGIAAAMILAGQVPVAPDDASLDGAELFERVVKRTRATLTRLGERGRLAVDSSGTRLPPEPPISLGTNEYWGGREYPCHRPPLVEYLPTSVELVDSLDGFESDTDDGGEV